MPFDLREVKLYIYSTNPPPNGLDEFLYYRHVVKSRRAVGCWLSHAVARACCGWPGKALHLPRLIRSLLPARWFQVLVQSSVQCFSLFLFFFIFLTYWMSQSFTNKFRGTDNTLLGSDGLQKSFDF